MDWVTKGYLLMAGALCISIGIRNLKAMRILGLACCAFLVIAGVYQYLHLENESYAIINLLLAVFGIWLGSKYISENQKFKKRIADLFYDRRN